jgi:hypothetical protein
MKNTFLKICVLSQVYLLVPLAMKAFDGGLSGAEATMSDISGVVDEYKTSGGLAEVVGNVVSVLLGTLGIVFLLFVVYAGFLYLTDQGEGKKAEKARKLLTTSVIGMVIIVAAYAITFYVLRMLYTIS